MDEGLAVSMSGISGWAAYINIFFINEVRCCESGQRHARQQQAVPRQAPLVNSFTDCVTPRRGHPPSRTDHHSEQRYACQKCLAFLSTLRNLQVSDEMAAALPDKLLAVALALFSIKYIWPKRLNIP
jgi:hypothetical protein